MQQVTITTSKPLVEVLEDAPPGKVAMFRVTSMSASSAADDWVIGEHVYVRDGKVYDFITCRAQAPVHDFGLHFAGYVDQPR